MLRKRFALVALVAIGGMMAAAPNAFGAQSANASCIAAGFSSLAPGQQDVFPPGTTAEIVHGANAAADALGVPPGQLAVQFAQQKGTDAECFPEGPPFLP
jgi:hypothetical protein